MTRLAFFASYNGSAAKAIVQACAEKRLPASPVLLVTNNPNAAALEWAAASSLETAIINAKTSEDPDRNIARLLREKEIDLAICSGYMKLIGPQTIQSVKAILNTHPALLPKFGGKGMYGRHVHQAVFDAKETETGISIHLVDGEYDHGRVIAQKRIPVRPDDTVEDIEARVKAAEPEFYGETLEKIFCGEIPLTPTLSLERGEGV
jgi:phosphoribosylglycinamide formyltransferase-1